MLMRLRSAGRKWARLPSPDQRALVEAAILLPIVSLGLRTVGLKAIQRYLDRERSSPARQSLIEARRLAALVEAAARRSPMKHNCLQRSVVLWRVLRRRELEAELRMGVSGDRANGRRFHAWVEHDGEVLNDVETVREHFVPFGTKSAEQGKT